MPRGAPRAPLCVCVVCGVCVVPCVLVCLCVCVSVLRALCVPQTRRHCTHTNRVCFVSLAARSDPPLPASQHVSAEKATLWHVVGMAFMALSVWLLHYRLGFHQHNTHHGHSH